MKHKILEIIKIFTGSFFYNKKSYAQEGEDLVVDRLLEQQRNGFYVEVGCHHPFRFSNTYFFYKRGWQGVCIDPLPGTSKKFKKWRPRDITIEMGVSETPSVLDYYMFNEPALNTFSNNIANERDGLRSYKIINIKKIHTDTLGSILEKQHINKQIDLMSIDVEGLELQVLKSNNWDKFRPKIIIAECLNSNLCNIIKSDVYLYLCNLNYQPYAKTGNSVIFISTFK